MNRSLFVIACMAVVGCSREFEPDLRGWKARTAPGSTIVNITRNDRQLAVQLPGAGEAVYRYAQWTAAGDNIMLLQIRRSGSCQEYRIVTADTTGTITDTVYVAPPNTAVNFKLSPNDSLVFLKTYFDDCKESRDYRYSFINRYTGDALPDTIAVEDARGILLRETIWSPDSKRVIVQTRSIDGMKAFVYDLTSKERTPIDFGTNFIWSPVDKNIVAYLREHSIYTWNMATRERVIFYEGKSDKSVIEFRWNPTGTFMMMHVRTYLLNMEAGPFQQTRIMYLATEDKRESRMYYSDEKVDTWRDER